MSFFPKVIFRMFFDQSFLLFAPRPIDGKYRTATALLVIYGHFYKLEKNCLAVSFFYIYLSMDNSGKIAQFWIWEFCIAKLNAYLSVDCEWNSNISQIWLCLKKVGFANFSIKIGRKSQICCRMYSQKCLFFPPKLRVFCRNLNKKLQILKNYQNLLKIVFFRKKTLSSF